MAKVQKNVAASLMNGWLLWQPVAESIYYLCLIVFSFIAR